jgi:sugar O-acyltransferase, sialic acid O-acetyltransferase NeuD family
MMLGGGGHARVLIEALLRSGASIAAVVESDPATVGGLVRSIPVIAEDDFLGRFSPDQVLLVNGIGSIKKTETRQRVFDRFKGLGYDFHSVIDPSAVVASDALLGEGAQLIAGSIIQPGSRLGSNVIVNTGGRVDHDCDIGDHVHIAPGVTLSGGVRIGAGSHIGTGSTIIQGITIGAHTIIGAGAVVVRDVKDGETVVGIPAKVIAHG